MRSRSSSRRRVSPRVAALSDHLRENPEADLGAPRDLARQFADELGTRLARSTAYRAFVVLAGAAIVLVVMFFKGGRTWGGWVGYGNYPVSFYFPWWWVPMMFVWFISAQIALAAGGLAHVDARWNTLAVTVGPALILLLLAMLPDVLRATRLRPAREGAAGDLTIDLGTDDPHATPGRIAAGLSVVILLVMIGIGARSGDLYAGILRGLLDAAICLAGFVLLGRYLGLRGSTASSYASASLSGSDSRP